MKVLVFSDSHNRTLEMHAAIEREKPDCVIHCGDLFGDAEELRHAYPNLTVYAVRGNCDYCCDAPESFSVSIGGVRFYVTHGHRDFVTSRFTDRVMQSAEKLNCAAAVFGHTHVPFFEQVGSVLTLNPGSITLPRGGSMRTYCRLIIQNCGIDRVDFLNTEGENVTNRLFRK